MFGSIGAGLAAFGFIAYAVVWIAVVVYVLFLAKRFVHAAERIATAMERREDDRTRSAVS
jgi:CcmD family protein